MRTGGAPFAEAPPLTYCGTHGGREVVPTPGVVNLPDVPTDRVPLVVDDVERGTVELEVNDEDELVGLDPIVEPSVLVPDVPRDPLVPREPLVEVPDIVEPVRLPDDEGELPLRLVPVLAELDDRLLVPVRELLLGLERELVLAPGTPVFAPGTLVVAPGTPTVEPGIDDVTDGLDIAAPSVPDAVVHGREPSGCAVGFVIDTG